MLPSLTWPGNGMGDVKFPASLLHRSLINLLPLLEVKVLEECSPFLSIPASSGEPHVLSPLTSHSLPVLTPSSSPEILFSNIWTAISFFIPSHQFASGFSPPSRFSGPFILISLLFPWLEGSLKDRIPGERWGTVLGLGRYGMGLRIRRRGQGFFFLLHQSNVLSYLPLPFLPYFKLLVELIFPLPVLLAFLSFGTYYLIARGWLVSSIIEWLCGRLVTLWHINEVTEVPNCTAEKCWFSKTRGTRINLIL